MIIKMVSQNWRAMRRVRHFKILTGEGMRPADLDLARRSVGLVISLVVTST